MRICIHSGKNVRGGYRHDFSEQVLPSNKIMMNSSDMSVEDWKFLHNLENETAMKDVQGLRKMICLKRRFLNDKSFFQDYKNSRMIFWYAQRSDRSPLEKTWYIPYHGVYQPSKLGKICVIFDYSTEIQGRSKSRASLWTRLDISSSWCLNTLSTRTSSIHAWYVETMYYQVMVPDRVRIKCIANDN